ncbi:hypothetical protein F4677DRAFT_450684 [Hypoxylon crocopeplum]|nr:hypothetical protein F4677DRAFT_450684 [Hypoxylon crocopeplum]
MASNPPKPKVYRLRGCPAHLDRLGATELLSRALGDVSPVDIRIQSLATTLDPRTRPPTKVATLMFRRLPALIEARQGDDEWKIPVDALEKPLLLDTHFLGMTPLNDVEREKHEFDCIAISGLASHPFGSWQPKGEDKSFMWIRDELPRSMPNMRAVIYGYDTALVESKSFQTTQDLAVSLVDHIKASGWTFPSAKSLVFLAHNLGGIVLKEALAALASGREQGIHILSLVRGGVFFGVPSQGMATSHLLAMVRDHANEPLVQELSRDSEYLRSLDDRFSGLSFLRGMRVHWAYETKTSPTVTRKLDGSFARDGQEEILVSKESATRSLYGSQSSDIFPINENHSEIVKFRQGDPNLSVVVDKLKEACREGGLELAYGTRATPGATHRAFGQQRETLDRIESTNGSVIPSIITPKTREWTIEDLIKSLEFPDQDYRIDTINKEFEHTFEWIFDTKKTSLPMWLKHGSGFFWIHGKPGSGKSTLMKFIFQNQRIWELLHKFPSNALQISASFFFHDRGSLLQKSFEGLLRSVLYQILKGARFRVDLTEIMKPFFMNQTPLEKPEAKLWTIDELENCMSFVFRQTKIDLDIFLLLDALDEYDGQPDFICNVLNGLMGMTANSRTTLKILFSGRPWEAFKQQFRGVPSVQLQDYTKDDIREYCWGTIDSKGERVSTALVPIVPRVIDRAEGVFLWVKLVLYELVNEVLRGKSRDELVSTLNSMPSDLQQYYGRIIERIPESLRWDAYVILEVLSVESSHEPKSDQHLREQKAQYVHSPDMIVTLECSTQLTYEGCRQRLARPKKSKLRQWLRLRRPEKDYAQGDQGAAESRILASTGSLVEIIHDSGRRGVVPQLTHQTVKEFVHHQDFKRSILGYRARLTDDNGHSFLAKAFLAENKWAAGAFHIERHETTTGRNMKDFIDSIPNEAFSHPDDDCPLFPVKCSLGLIGFANLQLYLKETLRRDPDAFRNTQEKLLSLLPIMFDIYPHECAALVHLLFENGCTISQDPQALQNFFQYRLLSARKSGSFKITSSFDTIVALFITHGQDPNEPIRLSRPGERYFCIRLLHETRTVTLARCLLENGAEVNALDSRNSTPLDCVVDALSGLIQPLDESVNRSLYETAKLLIEYGGIAEQTTRDMWERCFSEIGKYGWDEAPLRQCFNKIQRRREGLMRHQLAKTSNSSLKFLKEP